MVKLQTKRLVIRDHIEEDLTFLHSLISDKKAMFYLEDIMTNTLEESKKNLKVSMDEAKLNNREKYFFAITDGETGEYIGEIGFTVFIDCPQGKIAELGYFILQKFWGQGIVTEAARAVLDFAFEKAGVIKIKTGCIKDNGGSEGVMKKLGMIKEGEFKLHVLLHNKLYDRVEYRILKEEWQKLKEN